MSDRAKSPSSLPRAAPGAAARYGLAWLLIIMEKGRIAAQTMS